MNRLWLYLAGCVTGFLAAFLFGIGPDRGGRATARDKPVAAERTASRVVRDPERIEPPPPEEAETAAGSAPLPKRPAETEPAPLPGTRLPDGRIVGGARWNRMTLQMAVGFLGTYLDKFLRDANLTPEQEARMKAEFERTTREAMQIVADVLNGDVSGDQAYDIFGAMAGREREVIRGTLDEKQSEVFLRFEAEVKSYVSDQIINNEVAALRDELRLDPDQEGKVAAIVRERYARIGEGLAHPIPSIFFRPVRRAKDAPVYEETARRISEYLRPDQRESYQRWEGEPDKSIQGLRNQLVPR